jgi:hypothetical protein
MLFNLRKIWRKMEGNDGVEGGRSKNFRFDEYEVRDAFLEFSD